MREGVRKERRGSREKEVEEWYKDDVDMHKMQDT